MQIKGGCLCGAVRYAAAVSGERVVDYCHCRQCRQSSGAPVLAWAQLPPADFRLTQGQAKPYRSSAHATRWFCADCGSPLYMTDDAGRSVGITLGTLDTPGAMAPTVHGWETERVSWFKIDDHLPRHAEAPPYDL